MGDDSVLVLMRRGLLRRTHVNNESVGDWCMEVVVAQGQGL